MNQSKTGLGDKTLLVEMYGKVLPYNLLFLSCNPFKGLFLPDSSQLVY